MTGNACRIVLVTGPVGAGKTTLVEECAVRARTRGGRVGGYVSRRVLSEAGEREGYDLVPLDGGPAGPFLRRGGAGGRERTGRWVLLPAGLVRAEAILRRGVEGGWLVVDEVGPLEMRGRGIWPALEARLRAGEGRTLIVAREKIVEALEERLTGRVMRVFRTGEPGLPGTLAALLAGGDG